MAYEIKLCDVIKTLCICVLDPFVFYRSKASFVQRLGSSLDVNGLAVCCNRIFLTGISSTEIEVYDAVSFRQLQTLTVSVMTDPWDIAASPSHPNLYIFEGLHQLLRLDPCGRIVTSWTLDGDQCSLSVSRTNSVIVTYSDRLEEFNSVGTILRSTTLDRTVCHASHSVRINSETLMVCHGSGRVSIPHSVCLIDSDGRIMDRYQESGGCTYQPLYLAVADHGSVLVADVHGRRVQILHRNLRQSYDLISTVGTQNGWPLRVCYDSPRGNVYVCTLDGNVLVYQIRTRDWPRTECLDVHSGLIPGELTDVEYDFGYELEEE